MNPVAYLLLFLYIDTAEIVSDSAAVDGCTKEKRQDYAKLLYLCKGKVKDMPPDSSNVNTERKGKKFY